MISVHGLENMNLLKGELNKVGKGFVFKWNQVSILLQTRSNTFMSPPKTSCGTCRGSQKESIPTSINTRFKNSKEKQCYKVEDLKNVTIVGM